MHDLLTDVRSWRRMVQEALQVFSRNPAAGSANALRERLTVGLKHLEGHIEKTMDKAGKDELSDRDGENFYRLLGSYRGLSEAVIEYAATAEGIEWDRWREYRF